MYAGYYEEGDKCPEKGCYGHFDYIREGSCSCHINPPCSSCTDAPLTCKSCGFQPEEPESVFVPTEYPGLRIREYKPRPLDKTKIDWRSKSHSSSSMIKEGVYPKGTSREEVEAKVKGTFGGRFEHFDNGRFKYVAYTD